MKILFIDSTNASLKEELENLGMRCVSGEKMTRKEIEDSVSEFDGLIVRSRMQIDKKLINKAKNLKFIARLGSGMEHIDVVYAQKRGIECLNSPEGNRDAVGEHALGMLIALFKNLCFADSEIRQGKWLRQKNKGIELKGKTIGIIGYGNTGSAFALRLKGFNVNVIAYDKYKKNYSDDYVRETTMKEIFEETDILSMHVPLTKETFYLVNDKFIKKFKKDFYLINTSRGQVVKTDDLVKNLKSGKILGACLDVLEYEAGSFEKLYRKKLPPAFDYLIKSHKVILSPHIAGFTYESDIRHTKVIVEKIKKCLSVKVCKCSR